MNEAIERLEMKVAYLEVANTELSDAVYRQQKELDALRERLITAITHATAPMKEYVSLYDPFLDIVKLTVQELEQNFIDNPLVVPVALWKHTVCLELPHEARSIVLTRY